MDDCKCIKVPLRKRDGEVRAYALIDECDKHLAEQRWHLDSTGYPASGRRDRMHRIIMQPGPKQIVDHINGDKLDNRRVNLRTGTQSLNLNNQPLHSLKRKGASQYRGVYLAAGCGAWYAQHKSAGYARNLGRFRSEKSAALAAALWRMDNAAGSPESTMTPCEIVEAIWSVC